MDNIESRINLEKGFYYYIKDGMFIKMKIRQIIETENLIHIALDSGNSTSVIEATEKIKVKRPSNIISDFYWCYKLKNSDGDFIGYIGSQRK